MPNETKSKELRVKIHAAYDSIVDNFKNLEALLIKNGSCIHNSLTKEELRLITDSLEARSYSIRENIEYDCAAPWVSSSNDC